MKKTVILTAFLPACFIDTLSYLCTFAQILFCPQGT